MEQSDVGSTRLNVQGVTLPSGTVVFLPSTTFRRNYIVCGNITANDVITMVCLTGWTWAEEWTLPKEEEKGLVLVVKPQKAE